MILKKEKKDYISSALLRAITFPLLREYFFVLFQNKEWHIDYSDVLNRTEIISVLM